MATMTTTLSPQRERRAGPPALAPTVSDRIAAELALAELFHDRRAAADAALADLFPALRVRAWAQSGRVDVRPDRIDTVAL